MGTGRTAVPLPWASPPSTPGWFPTHRQEFGGLQPDGFVPRGRNDGGFTLGCRGGSDDRGPGWDLKLKGSEAQQLPA
jgi:hypothetical protein